MKIWFWRILRCVHKTTNTCSEYILCIDFPAKRASILGYVYNDSLDTIYYSRLLLNFKFLMDSPNATIEPLLKGCNIGHVYNLFTHKLALSL